MSYIAVYWQHSERVESVFSTKDDALDYMTDLWAAGNCSPIEVLTPDGERIAWEEERP